MTAETAGRAWTDERLAEIRQVLRTDNEVWRIPSGELVNIAEDLDDYLDYAIDRLSAAERVIQAVRKRVNEEGWCIACGSTLANGLSTDDNPEGMYFEHRQDCSLIALDATTGSAE